MTFEKTVGTLALVLLPGFVWAAETNAVSAATSEMGAEVPRAETAATEKPVDPKFERYRTIMDRMPFGPEPVNFNPDAPGTAGAGAAGPGGAMDPASAEAMKSQEEQQIIAAVRVSALNVTPSGKIAVGFTDSSKQPSGTYYLKVGETRDGWTVKSADARDMKVTLEKDGVEATLALGEGSDGGQDGKKGGNRPRPQLGALNRAGLLRARQTTAEATSSAGGSGSAFANLRARRAQKDAERRAEAERQAAAAEQAKAERERAAAEREQQREALLQIQEELRRQREAKEQQNAEGAAGQEQNESAEAAQE